MAEYPPHPAIAKQLGVPGNEKCICPTPLAAMACPWGHMLECHYPKDCRDAQCSHFLQSADGDFYPELWDNVDDDEPECDVCHELIDECQCENDEETDG